LADWSVKQLTFAVECFIRKNSIVDIQQAFQHEFSNDCARGPVPTRKTPAWVNKWHPTGFVQDLKKPGLQE
jgi:hypothetical protein